LVVAATRLRPFERDQRNASFFVYKFPHHHHHRVEGTSKRNEKERETNQNQ
jgi:hypothetical protein